MPELDEGGVGPEGAERLDTIRGWCELEAQELEALWRRWFVGGAVGIEGPGPSGAALWVLACPFIRRGRLA